VDRRLLVKNRLVRRAGRHTIGRMRRRFLLGILLAAIAVSPAFAEPTWKLDANESSYSYVCGGGDWVAINGKGNSLTIKGECTLIEINGSGNKISVEAVGTIKISGNNNDIRYGHATEGKARPVIKNKGAANTVRRDQ
jgi:hypothetical protein